MAIAQSWIEYDDASPSLEKSPFKHDLPFLDLGTYHIDSWSDANNHTDVRKFVFGLRIQGSSAENIKIWLDGDRFDAYLQDNNEPLIRQNQQSRGYIYKVTNLDEISLGWHPPCRTATNSNLTATYDNGSSGIGATLTKTSNGSIGSIGIIAVALNDRVLVKDQTNPEENGIYVVTDLGSVSTPWILTRAYDLDQSDEIVPTMRVKVTYDGSSDEYYGLQVLVATPYTIGTTEIYWSKQPFENVRLSDCRLATDGDLIGSFAAGVFSAAPSTLDGVDIEVYDRILVKDQASTEENGVYLVQSVGTGANGVWKRVSELELSADLAVQLNVKVTEGSVNADKLFMINLGSNLYPFTINTTTFTWDEYVPLTVYGNHARTWNNLSTLYDAAMPIGEATITSNNDSYSNRIGLAVFVPPGEPNQDVRNIHLLTEFDTVD